MTTTFGPAYCPTLDAARLESQLDRIREFMLDGQWRTLHNIQEALEYPESSISAQLRHLRKTRFGCYRVEKRRRRDKYGYDTGMYEYRVQVPKPSDTEQQELF